MPFNVSAQSILRSISNTLGQLSNAIKSGISTPGGYLGPNSLTSSPTNLLASIGSSIAGLGGKTFYESGKQQPKYTSEASEQVHQPIAPRVITPSVSGGSSVAPTATGYQVAGPSASNVAIQQIAPQVQQPQRTIAPQDLTGTLGRLQAEVSGLSQSLQELTRTQAPIPSTVRQASGALPYPPASRDVPRGEEITGTVPPISPSLTRVPLSAILSNIPAAQPGGYVGLPEARALESRPMKRIQEKLNKRSI